MGVLVVNCPNRPKDEIIDCGVYGLWVNMRSHNVDSINGEVTIGSPLTKGQKLPFAEGKGEIPEFEIESARAQSAGAVIGTDVSGIPSTFLSGGIDPSKLELPPPAAEHKPANSSPKPAQAKEGGE